MARNREDGANGGSALVGDLKGLVSHLEDDLRERTEGNEDLKSEWRKAQTARRTACSFEEWREDYLTQVAVAWVLGCVFVRYMEDNALIRDRYLAGEGDDAKRAEDSYQLFIRENPLETDREYLYHVLREVRRIPAAQEIFAEGKTPLWALGPSGDGAREILGFFKDIDPQTGSLLRRFRVESGDTRLLGDLYQDLSESARKKYALLQTPDFIEEFILDHTLTPAIEEFGLEKVRMIDPACGSGHFLLGAFRRLFDLWQVREPGTNERELAQRALNAVHGIDLNPYAVAIARFRLIVETLNACRITRLTESPSWKLNVAAGDSLLHGVKHSTDGSVIDLEDWIRMPGVAIQEAYLVAMEEPQVLKRILGRGYHVVVGNPPYITVKDKALNGLYRERYTTCHQKYSLALPFTERFFGLAISGPGGSGYVGMITANSFMKREFGKHLVERFLPSRDLTHVIDTSGVPIPGHGTPTVILFGRNRRPVEDRVRAVMGIRGEPHTPEDASHGVVWRSIVDNLDHVGWETDYISVTELPRVGLARHPWSIGGGGAAELKERLDSAGARKLGDSCLSIGFMAITGEDDVFAAPPHFWKRYCVGLREFCMGEGSRDWGVNAEAVIPFMYEEGTVRLKPLDSCGLLSKALWRYVTNLQKRLMFGKYPAEAGIAWYEYRFIAKDRFRTPLSIAYAEVATHNHFVLDRGGKVFKQTAPIIKLRPDATEDDHLALLGLLNSSPAAFWMKQVAFPKGGDHVGTEGARVRKTLWDERFAFNATALLPFPIPSELPLERARQIDGLATSLTPNLPSALASTSAPSSVALTKAREEHEHILSDMIFLQEELDWHCYSLYGLIKEPATYDGPPIEGFSLGQRAFEIVMARRMASGELETTWFERHNSHPLTEIPACWPEEYRRVVERRIDLMENDPQISLIEQPEYKRRWNREPWDSQVERALRGWLVDRLETERYWPRADSLPPRLRSCAELAEECGRDSVFLEVAGIYRGHVDFKLEALVEELVSSESVPFLPILRYTAEGLRKRAVWEKTWALQRREDAGENVGEIPVPPKYSTGDFRRGDYWRLRGKLDVPKERWVSYPYCERGGDGSLVVTWAGYDHLGQARALATHYHEQKEREGWEPARLAPLLAGLQQLIPWLLQWHNEVDPALDLRMGDFFQSFVDSEAREIGSTAEEVAAWQPPQTAAGTRKGSRRKAPKVK